jgi:hypothetical protein
LIVVLLLGYAAAPSAGLAFEQAYRMPYPEKTRTT